MRQLMLRAATRGLIDFSQAKPDCAKWHAAMHAVLWGLYQDSCQQSVDLRLRVGLAQIPNFKHIDPAQAQRLAEQLTRIAMDSVVSIQPWLDLDQMETDTTKGLMSVWEKRWGNMNDPEVQKKIAQTVEGLLSHTRRTEPGSAAAQHMQNMAQRLVAGKKSAQ